MNRLKAQPSEIRLLHLFLSFLALHPGVSSYALSNASYYQLSDLAFEFVQTSKRGIWLTFGAAPPTASPHSTTTAPMAAARCALTASIHLTLVLHILVTLNVYIILV